MTNREQILQMECIIADLERRHAEAVEAEAAGRAKAAEAIAAGQPVPKDLSREAGALSFEIGALAEGLKLKRAEVRAAKARVNLAIAKLTANRKRPLEARRHNLQNDYRLLEARLAGRSNEARVSPTEFRERSAEIDRQLAEIAAGIESVDREIAEVQS